MYYLCQSFNISYYFKTPLNFINNHLNSIQLNNLFNSPESKYTKELEFL